MDIATLLGLVIGVPVVTLAFVTGPELSIFLNLPGFLIVCGGTFAATLIKFPISGVFVAFFVGGAKFASGVEPTLKRIASILRATRGQILVSGHTDNSPISTARFRSNWDLSSARAVSVVHFLITRAAVSPSRITALGVADSRPLVKNATPANQSRNRRVAISIEITSFQG